MRIMIWFLVMLMVIFCIAAPVVYASDVDAADAIKAECHRVIQEAAAERLINLEKLKSRANELEQRVNASPECLSLFKELEAIQERVSAIHQTWREAVLQAQIARDQKLHQLRQNQPAHKKKNETGT